MRKNAVPAAPAVSCRTDLSFVIRLERSSARQMSSLRRLYYLCRLRIHSLPRTSDLPWRHAVTSTRHHSPEITSRDARGRHAAHYPTVRFAPASQVLHMPTSAYIFVFCFSKQPPPITRSIISMILPLSTVSCRTFDKLVDLKILFNADDVSSLPAAAGSQRTVAPVIPSHSHILSEATPLLFIR